MEYTFENIRKHGLLLYEYIRGSHAYGLELPTSDTDTSGVFCMHPYDVVGIDEFKVTQVSDEKNDNTWYELGKFVELLLKANPTALEALFVPEKCILYMHPVFKELYDNRDIFVTKDTFNSFVGYAKSQIEKARGLNKKIVNPVAEKKDILDFCYTFKDQGTEPFKNFLERNGLKAKYCGLVHLPNMEQMYGVYYDWGNHLLHENITSFRDLHSTENRKFASYANEIIDLDCGGDYEELYTNSFLSTKPIGYRGAMDENNDTTQLRLSSVEKDTEPICYISFNENGFKTHCRQYKEYKEWVEKRNPQRYLENKEKDFDRKNMMHCARLLAMGIEIAKTGKVNVDRSNIDRDFLLSIRLGDRTYDELMEYLEGKLNELKEATKTCTLPETVDKYKVDKLLRWIRLTDIYKV